MNDNNVNRTKKCKYCMSDIDIGAVICPNCRKQQGKLIKCGKCKQMVPAGIKKCPNCGKDFRVPKWVTIIFLVIFIVGAIAIGVASQTGPIFEYKKIASNFNVSEEKGKVIYDILKSIGVSDIKAVAKDEALNDYYMNGGTDIGYRVAFNGTDTNNVKNTVLVNINADGKIIVIKLPMGAVLYENDKVLNNLKNYTMTVDEQSDYQYFVQEQMKKLLKSPSTAKFAPFDEWKFKKENGVVTLQAYVDSQNSFGATVRGEFQFIFDKDKNVTSLIFEGKEYMN